MPAAFFLTGIAMALLSRGSSPEGSTVRIIDSGSTNRAGFQIEVKRSGVAEMTSNPRRGDAATEHAKAVQRKLPSETVQRFYADLQAAAPVSALPPVHCMKSASFGSSLIVKIGNEQSPDLTCGDGGDEAMRNLIRDVQEIVSLFRDR